MYNEKHIYQPRPNKIKAIGSGSIKTGMVQNIVINGSIPKLIIPRLAPGTNKIQSSKVKFLELLK